MTSSPDVGYSMSSYVPFSGVIKRIRLDVLASFDGWFMNSFWYEAVQPVKSVIEAMSKSTDMIFFIENLLLGWLI